MQKVVRVILGIITLLLLLVLYKTESNRSKLEEEAAFNASLPRVITLQSDAFAFGDKIPEGYVAKGGNISPQLSWDTVPENTRSLAIMVTDYDAPWPKLKMKIVNHWALFNIPYGLRAIPQAITTAQLDSLHITVGKNHTGQAAYIGPRPMFGEHEYYFRIYALDFNSLFLKNPDRDELLKAIKGHVLGYGELKGRF